MPEYPLVFVHGWGCDPSFWDDLAQQFPEVGQHRIDLGFFGDAGADQGGPDGIYITHSLGTLWALKACREKIKGLIAINGFSSFALFVPKGALGMMKKRLRTEPRAQMMDFWQACDLLQKPDVAALNVPRLVEGLDWLGSWDETQTLMSLDVPVLPLTGGDDRILPLEGMEKMWHNFSLCVKECAGHALPQGEALWCARQIKDFLDDRKLEIKRSTEL